MIAWLREEMRLWKLDKEGSAARALYSEEIHKLHEGGDWHRRDSLLSLAKFESSEYEDEAEEIRSNRLVRRAQRLSLPIPPKHEDSDHWWESQYYGTWALTTYGTTELRKAIRQEKKERREVWMAWGGMLVSILSLVVAIIALQKS